MKKRLLLFMAMLCIGTTTAYSQVNAVNDTYTMTYSGYGLSFATSILSNDFYTGTPTITIIGRAPAGITLMGDAVSVAGTVRPGTYTFTYQLCDNLTPQNCDTATITVIVNTNINAQNDEVIIPYSSGSVSLGDARSNDQIGSSAATTSNTSFNVVGTLPTGLTRVGSVFTSTGLLPGKYVVQYELCDQVFSTVSNCDVTTTFTVYVTTQNGPLTTVRANNTVKTIGTQSSHKIIIAGDFSQYGGGTGDKIIRLNSADLTIDPTFNVNGPDVATDEIKDFKVLQPSNNIMIVGRWAGGFGGVVQSRGICVLDPNGNMSFGWNTNGTGVLAGQTVNCLALSPNNSNIVIAGNFTHYNGLVRNTIALLDSAGNPVLNFNPGSGFNGAVKALAIHNGKIIVGGDFTTYNGIPANKLVRLDFQGVLDPTFNQNAPGIQPATGTYVEELLLVGNDLYVGGYFSAYNSYPGKGLQKLNATTGYTVPGFNIGAGFPDPVRALAIQEVPTSFVGNIGTPNLYVGGDFTTFNNVAAPKIACLNATTGTANPLFSAGTGFNGKVHALCMEINSLKVLIGGEFTQYNGTGAERITRIFPGYANPGNAQNRIVEEPLSPKSELGISIYPNPSEGIFNIDFKGYDEQKFDITIYNALGQLVHKGVVTPENTNQIDLSRFDSGSYFITLQNNTQTINKIVIKK